MRLILQSRDVATVVHGTARHGTARHGTARHGNYNLWVSVGCQVKSSATAQEFMRSSAGWEILTGKERPGVIPPLSSFFRFAGDVLRTGHDASLCVAHCPHPAREDSAYDNSGHNREGNNQ